MFIIKQSTHKFANLFALLLGLVGGTIIYYEALTNWGSRTAPIAYACAFIFIFISRRLSSRIILLSILLISFFSICLLSFTYYIPIDNALTRRQELWNAYTAKGLERPLVGWGYADSDRAKKDAK